jgi:hypothetical protein
VAELPDATRSLLLVAAFNDSQRLQETLDASALAGSAHLMSVIRPQACVIVIVIVIDRLPVPTVSSGNKDSPGQSAAAAAAAVRRGPSLAHEAPSSRSSRCGCP